MTRRFLTLVAISSSFLCDSRVLVNDLEVGP